MYRAHQLHPPRGSPPPSSQEIKVMMQREYREKEGVYFNTLRDVIKELTGEELRTRQEILKKATDLLFTASEIRKQSTAQADALAMPYPMAKLENTASAQGYFPQSSPDFDAPYSYYGAPVQSQQQHCMSGAVHGFNPGSYSGYGQDMSGYPQL